MGCHPVAVVIMHAHKYEIKIKSEIKVTYEIKEHMK
jgi:hypothetical protein